MLTTQINFYIKRSGNMTSIGTQRKMDSLGRIVIPKEFRNFFNINSEDIVEIKMTTDGILIKNQNMK